MFTPELVNVFTASAGICPIVEFNISVRTSFSRAICTFSSAFLAAAAFFCEFGARFALAAVLFASLLALATSFFRCFE